MKYILPLLVFSFLASWGYAQDQVSDTLIVIPASYAESKEKPVIALQGQWIKNESDSIHLITHKRYQLIQRAIKNALTEDDCSALTEELLDIYKNSIEEADRNYIALREKYEERARVTDSLIVGLKSNLNIAQDNLNLSQQSLDLAKESLDLADRSVKKAKTRSIFQKVMVGFGGLGLGLLIGVVVNN